MPRSSRYRKIYVRCPDCQEDHDEQKVEVLNIEEDGLFGYDILTFKCPRCKREQKSHRRG